MATQDEHQRAAARQRGALVLLDLAVRAGLTDGQGRTGLAEIARRSVEAAPAPDSGISDQTVRNLLAGRIEARTRSVELFIGACLLRQRTNPRLVGEKGTPAYWKVRFDEAAGRVVDATAGLVRVGRPIRLADTFVQRSDVGLVAAAVDAGRTVVLAQAPPVTDAELVPRPSERVLSGLGGVGKSQLAAQYARQVWHDPTLELAIWTIARDPTMIVESYALAAEQLLGADPAQPERAAARLMGWLATTTRPWLIVLDDVQVPAEIAKWWPEATKAGQVIVTTRFLGESLRRTDRQVIEVGLFTREQAMDYLRRRLADAPHLCHDPDDRATPEELLSALAADLGYLPLALAHASAYLREEQVPVVTYRALFADQRSRLTELFVDTPDFPDPYRDTVATTWAISVAKAAELVPGGVVPVVMLFASVLDPSGMPRSVFTSTAMRVLLGGVLWRAVEATEVIAAVRVLHRFSLLTDDAAAQPVPVVRVHTLVQRATREDPTHTPNSLAAIARAAGDALVEIWPKTERDGELTAALRSNTQALRSVAEPSLWTPGAHHVLIYAGQSLGGAGMIAAARAYYEQLDQSARHYLGPHHPDTFNVRNGAAVWRGRAGDITGAVTALAELLADQRRVLGPDHPDLLATRHNLARWQGEAGDAASAAATFADLVIDSVRLLGPDHRRTLVSRHDLAHWQGEANNDPVGAVVALAELLADQLRVLGPDHPSSLTTRSNLVSWLQRAGDEAGAAAAAAELLADRVRVIGPHHPETLITRSDLARGRGQTGDPAGAATDYAEVLGDALRTLGPDHPFTVAARRDLAFWRDKAGDPGGAATAYADLLDDRLRVLGPDHPEIVATCGNLAVQLGQSGDAAGAATAYAELLTVQLRVLGPDHPDTLISRSNLAFWRGEAGDPAWAATAYADLLPDLARVLGPDHRHTTMVEEALAYRRHQATDTAT